MKLIIFILIVLIIAYGPVMQSEYCPAVNTGNVRRRC